MTNVTKVVAAMEKLRDMALSFGAKDFSAEHVARAQVAVCQNLILQGSVLAYLRNSGDTTKQAKAIRSAIYFGYVSALNGESFADKALQDLCSFKVCPELQADENGKGGAPTLVAKALTLPKRLSAMKATVDTTDTKVSGWDYTLVRGDCIRMYSKARKEEKLIRLVTLLSAVEVAHQIIPVVLEEDGSYRLLTTLSPLQKMVHIASAGLEVGGLQANPHYYQVMVINGDEEGKAKLIKEPFFRDAKGESTPLGICIADAGFQACLSVDGYGKQAYVVHSDAVLPKDSIFAVAAVNSNNVVGVTTPESPAKVCARTSKQIRVGKDGVYSTTVTVVVVALPPELKQKVEDGTATTNELAAIDAMYNSFGIGGAGGSKPFLARCGGVHRAVGSDLLGQKAVVGEGRIVVHPLVVDAVKAAGYYNKETDIICGLSAVKSAEAKASLVWTPVLVNGVTFLVAKVTGVDHAVTESAAALRFENTQVADYSLAGFIAAAEAKVTQASKTVWMRCMEAIEADPTTNMNKTLRKLKAEGVIQEKRLTAKANMQMLQSIEATHGRMAVVAFLEAGFETRMGKKAARDIQFVLDVMNPSKIDPKRIGADVSFNLLLSEFEGVCENMGILPQAVNCMVPAQMVLAILDVMDAEYSDFVNVTFELEEESLDQQGNIIITKKTEKVLVPSSPLALMWSESSIGGKVMVNGVLAELVKALADTAATLAKKKGPMSSNAMTYNMQRIIDVRDSIVGKGLANIPYYGQASLICSGWDVAYGEIASATLKAQLNAAARAYRCTVQELMIIWAKSPCVMYAAVRKVMLKWMKLNQYINGATVYANVRFVLDGQDDADGDKTSLYLVPRITFITDARPTFTENPIYKVTRRFVEDELNSLFVKQVAATVAPKEFISVTGLDDALHKALQAKANVSLFTSFQQAVSNNRELFIAKVAELLMASPSTWWFTSFSSLLSGGKTRVTAGLQESLANATAARLFSVWHALTGGVMQIEAMDLVKRADTEQVKQLALVLSMGNLGKFYPATTVAEAEEYSAHMAQFKGVEGDELVAAVNLHKNKNFNTEVLASIKVLKDYDITFAETSIGKDLLAHFGVSEAAITPMLFVLVMTALKEVGKHMLTSFDCAELTFANRDKIVRYTNNCQGLAEIHELQTGKVERIAHAQDNLQSVVINLAMQALI